MLTTRNSDTTAHFTQAKSSRPIRVAIFTSIAAILLLAFASRPSRAYSVLTHEEIIDLLWHDELVPLLRARFPNATADELHTAHAYAYGGSLIQDIGYYPFGSHLFSDLTHYVRSGDFVINLLKESQDINEYAFALGALAHYASDTDGHPAVNAAVSYDFPKLHAKFGPSVTYEDDPKAHIRTEFGFDVLQVAHDRFTSDAYHDFIGFQVSRPVLERAFIDTYGIKLTDVISDPDLAIGTFRYTVSTLIPTFTKVAIVTKHDEIQQADPTMTRKRFLYHMSRHQFEKDWGKDYKRPGFFAHFLAFLVRILPHVGPLSTLDIKVPDTTTEPLYMHSLEQSTRTYKAELKLSDAPAFHLENKDFDTGKPTAIGEYHLTDETYTQLLDKLAKSHFDQTQPQLRDNILNFFSGPNPPAYAIKSKKKWARTQQELTQLRAYQPATAQAVTQTGQ
ncbi:zinc dependent phospholipase C family protein [Acidicapsa dinghuensis]|uniref:Zinc dependent phospholipase C family protein n=1 Tax=Acidicapsa dinghuensis TaxID=2218256 RepID=A0ABW1EIP4_9BACT|nr:zinc dependent phospholipase C family protein [Acidicapsa dinghuensis]